MVHVGAREEEEGRFYCWEGESPSITKEGNCASSDYSLCVFILLTLTPLVEGLTGLATFSCLYHFFIFQNHTHC